MDVCERRAVRFGATETCVDMFEPVPAPLARRSKRGDMPKQRYADRNPACANNDVISWRQRALVRQSGASASADGSGRTFSAFVACCMLCSSSGSIAPTSCSVIRSCTRKVELDRIDRDLLDKTMRARKAGGVANGDDDDGKDRHRDYGSGATRVGAPCHAALQLPGTS